MKLDGTNFDSWISELQVKVMKNNGAAGLVLQTGEYPVYVGVENINVPDSKRKVAIPRAHLIPEKISGGVQSTAKPKKKNRWTIDDEDDVDTGTYQENKIHSDLRKDFFIELPKAVGTVIESITPAFLDALKLDVVFNICLANSALIDLIKVIEENCRQLSSYSTVDMRNALLKELYTFEQGALTIQSFNAIYMRQLDMIKKLGGDYNHGDLKDQVIHAYVSSLNERIFKNYITTARAGGFLPTTSMQHLTQFCTVYYNNCAERKSIPYAANKTIPSNLQHMAQYANTPTVMAAVCKYFRRGSCKHGDKCKFRHVNNTNVVSDQTSHRKGTSSNNNNNKTVATSALI
jgi:hypothetical protein